MHIATHPANCAAQNPPHPRWRPDRAANCHKAGRRRVPETFPARAAAQHNRGPEGNAVEGSREESAIIKTCNHFFFSRVASPTHAHLEEEAHETLALVAQQGLLLCNAVVKFFIKILFLERKQ